MIFFNGMTKETVQEESQVVHRVNHRTDFFPLRSCQSGFFSLFLPWFHYDYSKQVDTMMEAKDFQTGELETLEYVLEDFLEMKASLNQEKTAALKQFLFSHPVNGHAVSSVEGVVLANHLVVIDEGDPGAIDHLIFLNPGDGRIRVKPLSLAPGGS